MIENTTNIPAASLAGTGLRNRAKNTVGTTIQKTSVSIPLLLGSGKKGPQVATRTGIGKTSQEGFSRKMSGKAGPVKMGAKLDIGSSSITTESRAKMSAKGLKVKAAPRTTYKYSPLQASVNAKVAKTSAVVLAGVVNKVSMDSGDTPEYSMGVKLKAQFIQSFGGRKLGLTGIAKVSINPDQPKLAPDMDVALKFSTSKAKEKQD